jgi:hypothetical protein
MTVHANADRVFGIVFAVIGLALLAYSFTFRSPNLMGDPGPGFLPGVVGALFAVLGTILAIKPGNEERDPIDIGRVWIVAVFVALTIAYALSFSAIGFSWPSLGFMVATMALLGRRTPAMIAAYVAGSALFVALVGWVLLHVLSVPLHGVWFLN